ncbi:MAG: hypothetical protein KC912_10350 [Proteobacteria bacterium]|nr:hypothetical protein [Pseudomonadota bacterium]
MGELARRRQARDLWISRNHLRAGGIIGVCLLTAAFAAGAATASREVTFVDDPGWLDQTANTELVELLARVDAAGEPDGGLSRLTFPTALASSDVIPVAPPYGQVKQPSTQVLTEGEGVGSATPLPDGWAVVIDDLSAHKAIELADRLAGAGLEDVRIDERLVSGEREVRVGIGGLDSEAEASALLLRVRQAPSDEVTRARVREINPEE